MAWVFNLEAGTTTIDLHDGTTTKVNVGI